MDKMVSKVKKYGHYTRYWWVALILGVLLFAMGGGVLTHPGESYLALSVLFGVTVLLSGLYQIFIAINMPKESGKGWLLASGIIEIVLGVILCFYPAISAVVLVLFLGFWLLLRSLSTIGFASELRAVGATGTIWTILWGIVLMLCAFMILLFPVIGVGAIVIWLAISFMISGLALIFFAFHMRSLKKALK